jgi:hypothetical protein
MNQDFQTVSSSGQHRVSLSIFGNDLGLVSCIIYSSRFPFLSASIRSWISQIFQSSSPKSRSSKRFNGSPQRRLPFSYACTISSIEIESHIVLDIHVHSLTSSDRRKYARLFSRPLRSDEPNSQNTKTTVPVSAHAIIQSRNCSIHSIRI